MAAAKKKSKFLSTGGTNMSVSGGGKVKGGKAKTKKSGYR